MSCKVHIGIEENGTWVESSTATGGTAGPVSLPLTVRIRVEDCEQLEQVLVVTTFGEQFVPQDQFSNTPEGWLGEVTVGHAPDRFAHTFTVSVKVDCAPDSTCVVSQNYYVLDWAVRIVEYYQKIGHLSEETARKWKRYSRYLELAAILSGVVGIFFPWLLLVAALLLILSMSFDLRSDEFDGYADAAEEYIKHLLRELKQRIPEEDHKRVLEDIRDQLETDAQKHLFDELVSETFTVSG